MKQESEFASPDDCEITEDEGIGFAISNRRWLLIAIVVSAALFGWSRANPSARMESTTRIKPASSTARFTDSRKDHDSIAGAPHFDGDIPPSVFDPAAHPDWRLKTLSIEDIRVGMRVPALNPEGSTLQNDAVAGEHRPEQSSRRDAEARRGTEDDELGLETAFGNPDPKTWRVFRLEVEKQDQSGALEVALLRPADWLVEQQQSTALLALLAELQDSQATAPLPATADFVSFVSFVSFVFQSPSLSIFQRGPEQALACLDQVLAVAPKVGRLGAQGLTSGALDIARESLACSLVEGVESDLAWQDQVAAVLDGSAAGSLIWLEMPELGAVGLATVKSIEPCPPIKSGPGRIVTATFRHASAEVLDLTFSQASVPSFSVSRPSSPLTPDPSHLTLGVTAAHPFWSIDRESFVPAGELQPQEQVIGIDGQHFRLTSITPRAGPETVYNLEVALDHVYYVGENGVLVHNAYIDKALFDNDVLVRAMNGNSNALAAIRSARRRLVTPEQMREFLNVGVGDVARRAAFLKQNNIRELTTEAVRAISNKSQYSRVFDAVMARGHGVGDAVLAATGIAGNIPVFSGNGKLLNVLKDTLFLDTSGFIRVFWQ